MTGEFIEAAKKRSSRFFEVPNDSHDLRLEPLSEYYRRGKPAECETQCPRAFHRAEVTATTKQHEKGCHRMRRARNRSLSRHQDVYDLGRIPDKGMKFYVFKDADGRMISPSFFYRRVTAPIDEKGRMHGTQFAPGQDLPKAGTLMRSCCRRVLESDATSSWGAVIAAEEDAFEREEQARRSKAHAAYALECARTEQQRNEQANVFNASLGIPVPFRPAQKIVLNGCYEGNGSGANRRSVEHVQLKAALSIGRIKRTEGQLLCGASRGSFGVSADYDTDDRVYAISCKRCIEIAAKFRNDAA